MTIQETKTLLDILAILLMMLNAISIVNLIFEPKEFVFISVLFFSAICYFIILYLHNRFLK